MCHTAHRDSDQTNPPTFGRYSHCRGNKSELIRLAVAKLEVMRSAAFATGGDFYRHYEITPVEHVVPLGRVSGQTMELSERDQSLPAGPAHEDNRVQGRKRHGQI